MHHFYDHHGIAEDLFATEHFPSHPKTFVQTGEQRIVFDTQASQIRSALGKKNATSVPIGILIKDVVGPKQVWPLLGSPDIGCFRQEQ
jgi:hypothetical protein